MKKGTTVMILGMLVFVLSSCSYRDIEDNTKEKLEQTVENIGKQKDSEEDLSKTTYPQDGTIEDGKFIMQARWGNPRFEMSGGGDVDYEIYDVKVYPTLEEGLAACTNKAGVDMESNVYPDDEDAASEGGFLTMKVDIKNINYRGDNENGGCSVEQLHFIRRDDFEKVGTFDDYRQENPVYLDPQGPNEKEFWYPVVKPGEIVTCTLGFQMENVSKGFLKDYVLYVTGGTKYYEFPWDEWLD